MPLKIQSDSLSTRLLLAMFGTILVAQLISSAIFYYERKTTEEQWSALFWAERVWDLVRELEVLDAAERSKLLASLTRGTSPDMKDNRGAADKAKDDVFIGLFDEKITELLRSRGKVTIGPASAEARVDAQLAMLPDIPAKGDARFYDVRVPFADGDTLTFRLYVVSRAIPDSNSFWIYPLVLICALLVGVLVTARGITVPLSRIAHAADAVGRGLQQPPLVEAGPRELRLAARAFNSMQDRLHRYLDSRTRVLAAMSHDLRTPITRMLLRSETLGDPSLNARFTQDLQEMQSMVQGALDMLQGLVAKEAVRQINVDALLLALQDDFAELGFPVTLSGRVAQPLAAQPQGLRRLLTNLLDNSRKFARRAWLEVSEADSDVIFRVRDDGPGIPTEQLERVMEPYFRLEPSRGRTTGGTGLGLSIARDIAQAHGGHLRLMNDEHGGLIAVATIPRRAELTA